MANRIDTTFENLAASRRKGFIAYITAGDPSPAITLPLVLELERNGADIIELGVPFSDPLADGVVNQRSAERALKHNVSLKNILGMVSSIRKTSSIPLVLFTYLNPVLSYGLEKFARDAAHAGIDGILSLDLPPEEAGSYKKILDRADIKTIFLVAPTTPPARIKLIARRATGFIYYVSRTGVTGVREHLEKNIAAQINRIKHSADLPVAVGFGVSTPTHVKKITSVADAVVVGSAIVKEIEKGGNAHDIIRRAGKKVKTLCGGLAGKRTARGRK
jgi:tryptophan synthase alpha chain